jgi:hypothetical protein
MSRSQLIQLIVACEESRLRLAAGIAKHLQGDDMALLVANRVAALEALAEHQRLVPVSDHAFVPACDRRVPHARKARKPESKPAA